MIPRSVKAPTIPIPFHKLLKVVAVVDRDNPQTQELLDLIRAEGYEVEVCDRLRARPGRGRVGRRLHRAGRRRAPRGRARRGARRCAALGFRTPLWALADSRRIADLSVLGMAGRGRRLHLPGPADARVLCQAGDRRPGQLRPVAAAALLRRADGLRRRGQHRLRLPRPPGRAVLPQVAHRAAVLQVLRREHLPQRPVQCRRRPGRPADPRRRGRAGAEGGGQGLRRRPHLLRAQRHQHLEQGRHQRACSSAATWCCSTATTTSRCTRARWCGAGAIPVFLPTARNAFGMIGPVDWEAWDEAEPARADPRQPAASRTSRAPMHRGRSAWPASSCAPTTARSTTCARCWRRSATCATTCCGTRPGSATTPSTRCSTTTARCG